MEQQDNWTIRLSNSRQSTHTQLPLQLLLKESYDRNRRSNAIRVFFTTRDLYPETTHTQQEHSVLQILDHLLCFNHRHVCIVRAMQNDCGRLHAIYASKWRKPAQHLSL